MPVLLTMSTTTSNTVRVNFDDADYGGNGNGSPNSSDGNDFNDNNTAAITTVDFADKNGGQFDGSRGGLDGNGWL